MDVLRDLLVILILLLDKLLFGAPPPGDLEKHATEILARWPAVATRSAVDLLRQELASPR